MFWNLTSSQGYPVRSQINPRHQRQLPGMPNVLTSLPQSSVPSKAVCRKTDSALWKIGSTEFVRMLKKKFSCKLCPPLALKLSFWCNKSPTFAKLCRIGSSSKTLGNTVPGFCLYYFLIQLYELSCALFTEK